MKNSLPYYLYDAFSAKRFGGSQAAIVLNADAVNASTRAALAKEFGYPATVFVADITNEKIEAQFYSTVAELPMCGHGTVALISCLSDLNLLDWSNHSTLNLSLALPNGEAPVIATRQDNGKTLAMLKVRVAKFRDDSIDLSRLSKALGITHRAFSNELPIQTAVADFTHLIVPVNSLSDMLSLQPNFSDIAFFYGDHGIETITVICTKVEAANAETGAKTGASAHVRIRDFCPAVGVAESAAAGTTNAAVAGYLFRQGLLSRVSDGEIHVLGEQGIEIQRPSEIHSRLILKNDSIESQWVGGVASRVASGQLDLSQELFEYEIY